MLCVPQPFVINPGLAEQIAKLKIDHSEVRRMFADYQKDVQAEMVRMVQLTAKEVR